MLRLPFIQLTDKVPTKSSINDERLMRKELKIAVDLAGGDFQPEIAINGCAKFLAQRSAVRFIFFGDQTEIELIVGNYPALKLVSSVVGSTDPMLAGDMSRQKFHNSQSIFSLLGMKLGTIDVFISARDIEELNSMVDRSSKEESTVLRPVLAGLWPTSIGSSVVLDLAGSAKTSAVKIVELAVMGSAVGQIVFGCDRPTVGILNVGIEEVKGLNEVREAAQILREADFPNLIYHGFIEGDDISKGTCDVVVAQGYTGQIALKTADATTRQMAHYLSEAMNSTILSRVGQFLARSAFKKIRNRLSSGRVRCGVLLGLEGIVIKCYSPREPADFISAFDLGYTLVQGDLQSRIIRSKDLILSREINSNENHDYLIDI